MTRPLLLCLGLLPWLAPTLWAQGTAPDSSPDEPPPLITDRPDQTESSAVVPPGFVQLETGWTLRRTDEGAVHVRAHEFPGTLVRMGLAKRVELRLGWDGYQWEDTRGALRDAAAGAGDAFLGTKIYLRPEAEGGFLPEVAFLAGASVPIGEAPFSSQRLDPAFRFSLSHTLHDRVALGYNLGMVWESGRDELGERDTLSTYLYTLTLGFRLTERLGSFVEAFGDIAASASGGPANSVDAGFTYLLLPNLQLDLAGGAGLSRAADDWFMGAGVSLRLPR